MSLKVIEQRGIWWALSAVIILSGLIAMAISWQNPDIGAPLRPSLDFIGGTRLQFELDCTKVGNCNQPINVKIAREVMDGEGLSNSSIQVIDQHTLSIRTKSLEVEQRTKLQNALSEKIGSFDSEKISIDTVGPVLGRQLLNSGLWAVLFSFLGILIYLSFRFKFDYAFFAFVALFHDVLITIGIFSILGLVFGVEVDGLFVVAVLTIIGFSVNDTVVIYDRIRETITLHPENHINQIVDDAVNQTLGRSINTTLTVLLTLVALFLFGGETLRYFALALIIGFSAGAYSSIFIASTLLAWWRSRSALTILDSGQSSEPINTSS